MIAELYGKISSTGSNLNDKLEDNLTGDFFGSLRYVSFNKVMKQILSRTKMLSKVDDKTLHTISELDIDYWAKTISFWPSDELGEFDLVIELDKLVIGIEVKLYSGLSSDDNLDNSYDQNNITEYSVNQLTRESRILKKRISNNNKSALLIFIAPEDKCTSICRNVYERNIIENGIEFGYLSWEEILECLKKIFEKCDINDYERLIIEDLIALLKRKRLERFTNFMFESDSILNNFWFDFIENNTSLSSICCNKNIDLGGFYEFK